ncbi:leucine-rich repeat domain-containing protein, partial [Streptosporangium sp. NPDC001682]
VISVDQAGVRDRYQLTALPESLGNLTALTELSVGSNRLTVLPESVGNLTALTDLYLVDNQLTVLPESLGNLTALTELSVSDNPLTDLPDWLGDLPALSESTRLLLSVFYEERWGWWGQKIPPAPPGHGSTEDVFGG